MAGTIGGDNYLKTREPRRVVKWKSEGGVFKLSIFHMARKPPGHCPLKIWVLGSAFGS